MEHLSLEIFDLTGKGSKYARLPENASITITDTSEIFSSGDVWSYPFTLNVRANAHIFGTSGDMHGSRLHDQINKRKARLWVMGEALFLGYLILDGEAEVDEDGNVDVTFESGQKTFDEMIDGAKANQVPMISDVPIGMALWRRRYNTIHLKLGASADFTYSPAQVYSNGPSQVCEVTDENGSTQIPFSKGGEDDEDSIQQYPRMVFPKGKFLNIQDASTVEVDYLNTDTPYDDTHPYCNIALCYQRQGYDKQNANGSVYQDYNAEPEAQRGYEVMPANRVNSAPNFYVLYWLKALMTHLGIHIEENQMGDIEDLRRLFFVNTKCDYIVPDKFRYSYDSRFGRFKSLASGRLVPEAIDIRRNVKISDDNSESHFDAKDLVRGTPYLEDASPGDPWYDALTEELKKTTLDKVNLKITEVMDFDDSEVENYKQMNSLFHYAIATSECFPNVEISEVISALEGGFGIRLLFSADFKRVRIILLREVFRDSTVQEIRCDIISEKKVENSTRGFRMTYGDSEDTAFYYKGFADMLPHKKPYFKDNSDKHDYSRWNLDAAYSDAIRRVSAFDRTCYVTKNTGNAFGIKVDKDAKRYKDLHPSLFEYAGFMDAEDGDCSGDEDTIETVNVGFTPAIMNDVNYESERNGSTDQQRFALFVDETMRPRRPDLEDLPDEETQPGVKSYDDADAVYSVDKMFEKYGPEGTAGPRVGDDGLVKPGEFAIGSDFHATKTGLKATIRGVIMLEWGQWNPTSRFLWPVTFNVDGFFTEGYRLYLQDNYQPNDDGISPVESHDWGLTLGIMRGSGSDAHVSYGADPDDQEGNDTWDIVPGTNTAMHPDTCDNYGNEWDYGEGTATDGRVSLKLRAEKLNPYYNKDLPESSDNPRYLEITNANLRGRGLCDQFYKEYSYWTRNAKIASRTVRMELVQLLAIDKTKKVTVGDIRGYIRKMQYSVSNKTGLGAVTMEIMYI